MIEFFAFLIALAVALAISRIAVDVRKIRERIDFFVPAQRTVWKHQGIQFGDKADLSVPSTAQAVAETRKPTLHEREDADSRAYRAAHPDK